MIKRDRPSALRLLFVWRGSIVPDILRRFFGFALCAALIVAAADSLGLDRCWEARRLWGQLT
jgi:ion channel-forming bestrophin family protein